MISATSCGSTQYMRERTSGDPKRVLRRGGFVVGGVVLLGDMPRVQARLIDSFLSHQGALDAVRRSGTGAATPCFSGEAYSRRRWASQATRARAGSSALSALPSWSKSPRRNLCATFDIDTPGDLATVRQLPASEQKHWL